MKFQRKNYSIFILSLLIQITALGQSQYIGLENESNPAQQISVQYFPKSQIIDDYIYVPTPQGVYRKDLSTLNNLVWELFAFDGVPIRDFIKKGNEILANTSYQGVGNQADSLLIYSSNNGLSYNYLNTTHFEQSSLFNSIYRIAQNHENTNEILALHHQGVSKSNNFGMTWSSLHNNTPEYQYRFIDYHPLDTETIFYTGENGFYSSYVQVSYNNGVNWTNTDAIHNNCTHNIAFNPINQNIVLSAGEGRITKSIDKGVSWNPSFFLTPYIYICKIVYDESNSDNVYASGYLNGSNDTIYILKSTDGGDNWSIVHQEPLADSGGIIDFHTYEDKFIFITRYRGVFILDSNLLNVDEIKDELVISIYPNPSSSMVTCKSTQQIKKVEIFDFNGELVNEFQQNSNNVILDISSFTKGAYTLKLYHNNGIVEKTIIKK